MEKEPNADQGGEAAKPEETPPPFEPDPDIVTFLERAGDRTRNGPGKRPSQQNADSASRTCSSIRHSAVRPPAEVP